jgi:hypothetical protein
LAREADQNLGAPKRRYAQSRDAAALADRLPIVTALVLRSGRSGSAAARRGVRDGGDQRIGCDDRLVSVDQHAQAVPAPVAATYDQLMRAVVGPALRAFGFRGTVREFRYGSRSQFGVVAWQQDGRDVRRGILRFTANVSYWCGADRIGGLMPVPPLDTWGRITAGHPYDAVAESVIFAVGRHALPAIRTGLEDPGRLRAEPVSERSGGCPAEQARARTRSPMTHPERR